ncbi:hypothetical protein AB0I60_07460 [Actinosynnema sp. NPDC050436]|uniref:hypothetical protein n=1 Tax=Actinosynnema sp. NPDC050436 TaxID=3155659 RepID=UPI0033F462BE
MVEGDQADGDADPGSGGPASARPVQSAEAAASGVVIQAARDVVVGEVNLRTGGAVRTRYRHQVMRIAPSELVGRDAELADLAAFCTRPAAGPYGWWRAGAWAGKSALLSWFALHPPAGARVVSFFITARLAGQADRTAFVDNVLEQLLTLLGEEVPPFLTPATREAHLLGLLEEAAALCRARGEHLVLVVDGLDEDRGVTTGPDSHSIAALLPARPVAGLRVVVTGRPDPPVPGDVPADHPLRDPATVRALAASPQARAVRAEMERDLKRLLGGSAVEQDVLGLLVAAGGGLTSRDLAGLTGTGEWEVRDHLDTVTGRSFTRRDSDLGPGPEVYLLAHEDLQVTAVDMLGPSRLAAYRERVDRWAAQHRDRRWPPDAPEYLLRGHHTMLLAAGDLVGATGLGTDLARHDRLFERTGGDNAALVQVTATLDAQVALDAPDLVAAGRLAVHRDHLADRNTHIPPDVPVLWLRLGHPHRATALARSIPDPFRGSSALVPVAEALTAAGRAEQARCLLEDALKTSAGIVHHDRRNAVSARLASALAEAGDVTGALRVARSITGSDHRAVALASVALALDGPGRRHRATALFDGAGRLARKIVDPYLRCTALCALTGLLAAAGRADRAGEAAGEAHRVSASISHADRHDLTRVSVAGALARAGHRRRAGAVARAIPGSDQRAEALLSVAGASVDAEDRDSAGQLVGEAVRAVRSIARLAGRGPLLAAAARTALRAGDADQARELLGEAVATARSTGDPDRRSAALAAAAGAALDVGDADRARELLGEAVATARSVTAPQRHDPALATIAKALAKAGHGDRAVAAARAITDLHRHDRTVTAVAKALAEAGRHDQAVRAAHAVSERDRRTGTLVLVARTLAEAGWHDRAVAAAHAVTDPDRRDAALVGIARSLADAGQHERARQLLDEVLRAADATAGTSPRRHRAVTAIVVALVRTGQADRAGRVARAVPDHDEQVLALTSIAGELAATGSPDDAERLLEEALRESRAFTGTSVRGDGALAAIADAQAGIGRHDRAAQTARAIADPDRRHAALSSVAGSLADAGHPDRARRLVDEALAAGPSRARPGYLAIKAFDHVNRALMAIAKAFFAAGDPDRAVEAAHAVTDQQHAALTSIARALAGAHRPDGAVEAAGAITDADLRHAALEAVAEVLARQGHHDRAVGAARAITAPDRRAPALALVAETLADTGHDVQAEEIAEEALAAVDRREWTRGRDEVRASAARVLAKAGRCDRAEEVARATPDFHRWESALVHVAASLARAGHHERAAALVGTVPGSMVPDRVRVLVAEVLTGAGAHDRAARVVQSIGSAELHSVASMRLARDLAERGSAQAGGYAARALQVAHWTTALADLCALSPAAALAVHEEFTVCAARPDEPPRADP